MASNYPTTIQTFTDPQATDPTTVPDHAALHTSVNDTLEAIQTTVGTTAGTNVLKHFTAGDFPIRGNSGGTLTQTLYGGNFNNPIMSQILVNTGTIAYSLIYDAQINSSTLTLPLVRNSIMGSAVYSGTLNGTTTVNLGTATRHLVNLPNSAGSLKIELSNVTENQPFIIEVKQGTAGLGTVVWFSTISWAGSVAPTLTTTASRKDTFGFIATGTATFDGYIVGMNL